MGMFDSFYNVPINCPKCNADLSSKEWQTKDLDCTMSSYYWPTYVTDQLAYFHFYLSCQECGTWLKPKVILDKGFVAEIELNGQVLWELDTISALNKLCNEREQLRDELRQTKSMAQGLAAFIWRHYKSKRDKLFEVLNCTKQYFEKYIASSCYNPCHFGFGIIGGSQNYCWILENLSSKKQIKLTRKFNKILSKLPVGKERNGLINALVWSERKGVIE